MLRFNQFIKTILLEAKLEHFVNLNLDPENEHHNELLTAFNNNKEKLVKKHPAQYKDIEGLANAVSPYIKSPEVQGATLVHHNKETGAKVYHVHTDDAACKLSSDTWCTSKGGFPSYDKGRSFIFHFPNEPDRKLRKVGYFGDGDYVTPKNSITHNFQDASNSPLSDNDWNTLRKKHNLDKIPELAGLREIPITDEEKIQRENTKYKRISDGTITKDELVNILHTTTLPDHIVGDVIKHNHKNADIISQLVIGHTLNGDHINQLMTYPHDPKTNISVNISRPIVKNIFKSMSRTPNNVTDAHLSYLSKRGESNDISKLLSIKKDLSPEHITSIIDNIHNTTYGPITTDTLEQAGKNLISQTNINDTHINNIISNAMRLNSDRSTGFQSRTMYKYIADNVLSGMMNSKENHKKFSSKNLEDIKTITPIGINDRKPFDIYLSHYKHLNENGICIKC